MNDRHAIRVIFAARSGGGQPAMGTTATPGLITPAPAVGGNGNGGEAEEDDGGGDGRGGRGGDGDEDDDGWSTDRDGIYPAYSPTYGSEDEEENTRGFGSGGEELAGPTSGRMGSGGGEGTSGGGSGGSGGGGAFGGGDAFVDMALMNVDMDMQLALQQSIEGSFRG